MQFCVQGNVNTAPSSSVPETDEASLESRNAVSIDVAATNTVIITNRNEHIQFVIRSD